MHEYMKPIVERIRTLRVIPVVTLDDPGHAPALAEALVEGGLACVEITLRTAAAEEGLRRLSARSDILLGAGTVLSVDQAKKAVDAGAKFLVSPGCNPRLLEHCCNLRIPVFPGTATPTDVELALSWGFDVVKFFPAEAFGGLKTLKAIAAPYGAVRFIPTGGISKENLASYLSFAPVLACGGSFMCAQNLISAGRFDEITRLTKEAVEIARKAG